ncbi:MAG: Rne/Rng family ribonuclease [Armatimonadetes bacterium]|nr:Rne/Rng family ribonuclease [Armatimonadota bacterium]
MSKEILVNVSTRETRVAVVDNARLVELHIEREERVVGSLFKCKVCNVLPGMDAAFVDIGLDRNAFLYVGDVLPETDDELPQTRRDRFVRIEDAVRVGQELLVQVVKAPRGTKGARVSTRVSLPGRYLVFMPDADNTGVSRKIEESQERDRLKKFAEALRPAGIGLIVRTEAEGKSEADLHQDFEFLMRVWNQIQEKSRKTNAPGIVHQDLSLLYKVIRDVFSSDVQKLIIDSREDFEKAVELVDLLSPKLKSRVTLYDGMEPIFDCFGIEGEIDRLLRRKVWLKSGGHLTIDQTEALTTIDVNTGKFVGSTSLSDTIVHTNLEAVEEIARQLRLRDVGGIIIIDFIDMSSAKDRSHVMTALEKALKKDRMRTKIAHLSPLGLVEMTRKRTGETIPELLSEACSYCQGRGRLASPETVSIEVERELERLATRVDDEAFLVSLHPRVALYLIGLSGSVVDRLEKRLRRGIYVRADVSVHLEKYRVVSGGLQEIDRRILPYTPAQVVECAVERDMLSVVPRTTAWCEGYLVELENAIGYVGQRVKVRLTEVHRSYALGEVLVPSRVLDKSEPI